MRAILLAGLLTATLLAGIVPAAGQYQEMQATTLSSVLDLETDAAGWTTAVAPDDSNTYWSRIQVDGDWVFWVANHTSGAPASYDAGVTASLTTPMLDITSQRLDKLTFALRGSDADAGEDEDAPAAFTVHVREETPSAIALGEARWQSLGSFESAGADAFDVVDLTGGLRGFDLGHDTRFQLRFTFMSGSTCDGREPPAYEPPSPPVPPVPEVTEGSEGSEGSGEVNDPCAGLGNHDGWLIDDITLETQPFQLQTLTDLLAADAEAPAQMTATADSEDATQTWHRVDNGTSNKAYFASGNAATRGYDNNVDTTLETGPIETGGYRVRGVSYELHGSSWAGDPLSVEWRIGSNAWETLATYSGKGLENPAPDVDDPARDGMFVRVEHRDEQAFALLSGHPFDQTLQVRFTFTSDGECDSNEYVPPEDPPVPPEADSDPGAYVPEDPPCEPGTHKGWYVDDIRIEAWDIPQGATVTPTILPFRHPTSTDSVASVHATDDADKFIGFDLDRDALDDSMDPDLGAFASASVTLTRGQEVLTLALQKHNDGGIHWYRAIPVDHPDLHLGAHTVQFHYVFGNGTTGSLPASTLTVLGSDGVAPTLVAAAPSPQVINENGIVRVIPDDETLARVTYQLPSMDAPANLGSPYILRAPQFVEGTQTVTFVAHDRAGHATTLTHVVVKDTTVPDVNMTLPERFFQGIPYTVVVEVEDRTPSKVILRIGNDTRTQEVQVSQAASFTFEHSDIGTFPLELTVRDAAGNRHVNSTTILVEQVVADLGIQELKTSDGPFLAGDSVTFMATLVQHDGLIDIPTNVTFLAAGGNSAELKQTVPADGTAELTWSTSRLAPGRQTVTADLDVHDAIIETNAANDTASVDIEVFLGRTDHGDDSYHIRVSDVFGLPLEAVHLDSGSTFRLTVPDPAFERVYRFADGDLELFWDPLSPITVIPLEEEEPTPGLGLVPVLALLGLAVLRRRR